MKRIFAIFATLSLAVSTASAGDNIVVVLDGSGSMSDHTENGRGGTRMEVAKKALTAALAKLSPDTNLGVLVFEASGIDDEWIYPPVATRKPGEFLGKVNHAALNAAIRQPQPSGGTPLGTYIKKGADALLAWREKQHNQGTYRLIVVTDGETGDGNLMDQYVPMVRARGIIINAIGLDLPGDHALKRMVDSYQNARDPRSLATAVSKILAEVPVGKDPAATQATYDEIEGFDTKVAVAAIKALTLVQNQPIGEAPPPVVVSDTGDVVTPVNAVIIPANPVVDGVDQPASSGGMGFLFFLVVGATCVVVVFVIIAKANS